MLVACKYVKLLKILELQPEMCIRDRAQDVDIAKKVIAIKAEVEKIREQVQNIE